MPPERKLLAGFMIAAGAVFAGSPAEAQQGYEFGIRFNPVNFRTVNFGGFSFQQASFRPVNNQPIQFNRITFPAFSSRIVRRNANRDRDERQNSGTPLLDAGSGRRTQQLRVAVKNAALQTPAEPTERRRLILLSPSRASIASVQRGGDPLFPQSPRLSYSSGTGRSAILRSRSQLANRRDSNGRASVVLSRTRGETRTAGVRRDRVAVRSGRGALGVR